MRKEIEVKAEVKDIEKLEKELAALGCVLSEPIEQDDMVFINYDGSFTEFPAGTNFLRIRKVTGKSAVFTLKQPQKDNGLEKIEYETEIADPDQMREAILLMGYREAVRVHKIRRKTHYKDSEICLDLITGLGLFIEVEKISENEDANKIQDELFDFLLTLGIKKEDRVLVGYDVLIYLKDNKK